MAAILFDMFPAQGHYNGSFGLAQLLKNAGHKVYYTCPAGFQEKIRTAGFTVYLFNPFIIPPLSIELKEKGLLRFLVENWAGVFTGEKSRRIEENITAYDRMIERIGPDIIILDEHYAYKSIFYWKYHLPVVTIQTAVSPDHSPGIPPFNHPVVPDLSPKNRLYIKYLWSRHMVHNRILKIVYKILAIGNTSEKYYRQYAERYGFPYHLILRRRVTGIRFAHIPALIVPPEPFDFPRSRKHNLYFIGPLAEEKAKRDFISERLKIVFEKTTGIKKSNRLTKLVYCSLGTVTGNYLKVCRRFFKNIAEVCRRNPDLHIILSVGVYFDVAEIGPTPANLYVFNRVPQLIMLKACDFVITHGGMNTIFECIMEEKPMIVYPLSMDWDQNGNAARVAYHGIGIKGVLRRTTPGSILHLINELSEGDAKFRENIRHLKSKFEDRSSYALDLIDGFIKSAYHVN